MTDAFLVTGFLNPDNFLGGDFRIQPELAREALGKLARHYGISVEEAAFAVVRVSNNNAAQLLRLISVQRGFDPRDFTLLAYGGSGPIMAPYLAEELEIPKVVIPAIPPGNFSAWGLLMSDLRHNVVQTLVQRFDSGDAAMVLNSAYAALEGEIAEKYRAEGIVAEVVLERTADVRHSGQEHTINVPVSAGTITEESLSQLTGRFREHHQREYGFGLPGAVELVNLRICGVVPVPKPAPSYRQPATQTLKEAVVGERPVYWGTGGIVPTTIYRRDLLPGSAVLRGPAIIEESSSTIIVPDGVQASIDKMGNVILQRT